MDVNKAGMALLMRTGEHNSQIDRKQNEIKLK